MSEQPDTRQRIIDVAAVMFAQSGFKGASVRDICEQADANPASINYYFGSKFELYKFVLTSTFEKLGSARPMPQPSSEEDIQQTFRKWIVWYMYRVLGDSKVSTVSKLIAAELREPTEAFELLVTKSMRPLYEVLQGMVAMILEQDESSESVKRATLSVIGQCLIYVTAAPMIDMLHNSPSYDDKEIEEIGAQIANFALAGLQAVKDGR